MNAMGNLAGNSGTKRGLGIQSPGRGRRAASTLPTVNADTAKLTVAEYCLFHYPTLFTAGMPRLTARKNGEAWLVPVVLTHPQHGLVGEVGEVLFQGSTGAIVYHTPRRTVVAAGKRLQEAKLNGRKAGARS